MTDIRRIPDLWRRWDVTVRDLPFAVLLAALSFLPGIYGHGTQIGGLPSRPFELLAVVVIGVEALPLALRRKWPALALFLVLLGFVMDQLRGYHALAGTALPIVLFSAGAHLERYRRAIVIGLSAAYVPVAVALMLYTTEQPGDVVALYVLCAISWGLGGWLRSYRASEAERRRAVAAASRAAERSRIARDLHDVVTHHVTAMVVQAEAAKYLAAAPERLDDALTTVTDTGRAALSDLRHLLELLNPGTDTPGGAVDDTVAPTVGELHELVEQTRRAGQPVEFTEEGSPAEPAGSAGVTAYRVVQEALTNALKYAHGGHTIVRVRHGAREITVEVATDGSGTAARSPGGSGRGLAGLRERVDALGGEFGAGPCDGGGYLVRARIPAGSPA